MLPSLQAGDRDPHMHGRPKTLGVGDEVTDDLVLWHESVRILSAIAAAGQLDRPIGNDKAEAVPAPAPCLTDTAPFENDVVNACTGELVAHRKPCLSGADDHGVDGRCH